jgi:hypothetical protein
LATDALTVATRAHALAADVWAEMESEVAA